MRKGPQGPFLFGRPGPLFCAAPHEPARRPRYTPPECTGSTGSSSSVSPRWDSPIPTASPRRRFPRPNPLRRLLPRFRPNRLQVAHLKRRSMPLPPPPSLRPWPTARPRPPIPPPTAGSGRQRRICRRRPARRAQVETSPRASEGRGGGGRVPDPPRPQPRGSQAARRRLPHARGSLLPLAAQSPQRVLPLDRGVLSQRRGPAPRARATARRPAARS